MDSETLTTFSNNIKNHLSVQSNGSISAPDPPKQPFVIGVAGGTASGKTTVCNMIISQLHDQRVVLVNQDSFYHSLSDDTLAKVYDYNFDHPGEYSHHQTIRFIINKVNPSDIIILEGILVLHDSRVRDLMNMKIFVDTGSLPLSYSNILQMVIVKEAITFLKTTVGLVYKKNHAFNRISSGLSVDFESSPTNNHHHNFTVQILTCDLQEEFSVILLKEGGISRTFLIRSPPTFEWGMTFLVAVVEHGLGHLPFIEKQITTPTGSVYPGVVFCKRLCGVSVIRSGESMENAVRACCKGIKIGKILIHGEGNNGRQLIYEKLPEDISSRHVLLLDPVLASGNSAVKAINLLLSKGVVESNIIFLNLIAAPQGIHMVCKKFPKLKIVTSEIDVTLDEDLRVIPGMGEFGDRYFGTNK
ncbi:hypothetical protein SADUNF_Sadunf17G0064000 [Salix dunnii]|uniref:uracil phosphoribosyltransferase n=1 Tax=Salix dunnii TaxID=1413687 RepID=A0A835MH82_9ROSI|nr:hypothetical protein SADUNF_Sadunf17G0064000 [Salix dunnii]